MILAPEGERIYELPAIIANGENSRQCSGGTPCDQCQKSGLDCSVDEEGDQRRKKVLKRKFDSVSERGKLLDRLVNTLQETDRIRAAQIMNLIRSHASLEEVQSFMDDIMDQPKLEKTPELVEIYSGVRDLTETHKRTSLETLDQPRLSESIMIQVPAHPWTAITSDSEFVSHLISLWFSWSHPFLNWLDRDLFIRDMQSGNIESEFCSPFLVNIILADACAYSDYPEAYAISGQSWSRGLQFYKEAKHHLDRMEGKATVSYVQGLGVLYVCTCMMGKDRSGWIYHGQLVHAVQELAQNHHPAESDSDQTTLRTSQATDTVIWGIFNLASMTALSYQKRGSLTIPNHPYPPIRQDVHREKWTNYPLQSDQITSHSQCLFNAFCKLSVLTYELSWLFFGKDKARLNKKFVESTENVYNRLYGCLKYHTIIQTVFGFLRGLPREENDNETESVEWEDKIHERAQQICFASARECGQLIDAHRDGWGFDRMSPVNVHWITVSMFTLLQDLENEASCKAFVNLSVGAKAFANRWPLGKAMLRLVQVTAKQMEVKLPSETDALFIDFETRIWNIEDRKLLSSQYPNFAHSMKRGQVDEIEMDAFLAKFDDLYVESDKSEPEEDAYSGSGVEFGSTGDSEIDLYTEDGYGREEEECDSGGEDESDDSDEDEEDETQYDSVINFSES
ncbi:hypothetical protein N7478_001052 [Penicillium angulare]|uniref:uncharacterized protein n=1 Tax=Penicillium angulare TaxID=116970 RepID=UPI0025414D4B|nr:uncharacterized protein N7478_001052 [Penicillium angulare]KAJ5291801.1 hypothetical protein N7478_001052 [Penicillium angulare]